ncbi:iron chaperone [Luteimicrobium subarcticum]|uniref:Uncharacterized protein YdhG (YjbR/CyaY superfamily) n=1 Tax=Luteimicrobium subarcticum TaxID=620910 RepID=A0A2M8WJR5_9MICO|nr:DUF1801 domain-containing protein [Luteimicrobium subarcticum]PJI91175.1 uncharacterized protein YdhG (YjbR/CyaY superfamily) [Luteimicrobium subarcticum]
MSERGEGVLTDAEKAAMQDRAAEQKASRRGGGKAAKKEADKQALLDKIAEMGDADRAIAERIHAIVTEVAPDLDPKTWYGMPAYAQDGKVLCFVQPAEKFGARYATFGFNDVAALDDGDVWATSFAITAMTDDVARTVTELVRRAVG